MVVTNSYMRTSDGSYHYNFYLVIEDYIEAQTSFMKEFNGELERFSRNLKLNGALYRPYYGDIETIRAQICNKPWEKAEQSCLDQTPGLLILDVSFAQFDPRIHPWVYFSFDVTKYHENQRALKELANLVNQQVSLWDLIKKTQKKYKTSQCQNVLEIKLGIWGFSVDLIKWVQYIKACF